MKTKLEFNQPWLEYLDIAELQGQPLGIDTK